MEANNNDTTYCTEHTYSYITVNNNDTHNVLHRTYILLHNYK
jgi:hypothetical protein